MASSTLHFKKPIPWLAVKLLAAAAATWVLCATYVLHGNAELSFLREAARVKRAWARQLTADFGNKIIAFGGSSCAFAIDGERLLQKHGLPVANYGFVAGIGPKVLALFALSDLQRGDSLVVACEPAMLTAAWEAPDLGTQFSFDQGHPEWITHDYLGGVSASSLSAWLALRPGGRHVFTMLGKRVRGQQIYRYTDQDVSPSGWVQTAVRFPFYGSPGHGPEFSPEAGEFLRALRRWCDAHGVRLFYSLPWGYTPPADCAAFQKQNAAFLLKMLEFMPVLKDQRLGAHSVREHFADTEWHLSREGAALRSDALAQELKQGNLWTVNELRRVQEEGSAVAVERAPH